MILTGRAIVFMANTKYDSAIQATSLFLARSLAKNNKVYFVDYPFTLKDYIKYQDSEELKRRQGLYKPSSNGLIDTELPNFKIIIVPPVFPINFLPEGPVFRSALKINEAIMGSRINKALKADGVKEFILINSFNFHFPNIAKLIKPVLTVYQCVDPMIVPYDMKHGFVSEEILVKKSDLVICTSKALYNEKRKANKNTYFVPNAADVTHFGKATENSLPVHPKIKDLPKPVIGYLGSIERRIDYKLLTKVVEANPEKTFVLAGPVWHEYVPKALSNAQNLHIIGPVDYNEVPSLIKGFDVAIIPFKKDKVSDTIFPLKLFEYLSAGKPVVITDFNPDLKEYTGDLVDFCPDAYTFTEALNVGLQNNTADKVQQRIALAAQNTWEKRAEEIGDIINAHLKHQPTESGVSSLS
ncbi:glycosyltransferase [Mucilaginibacter sp. KACC 22063]|uniref:glycosyltransferase n=1 Tax=Mucilaginibacter sp. KACC 22063 TaxID=3025666 RepID=UPI0023664CAD|nr:glycosyltransferase [Mucilaginibacter sp. KACC 22063]WDF56426.1 glycosyltransferase [Mucilaginibacter sp. KACC 22063]